MGQVFRSLACGVGFHEECHDDKRRCGCYCHKRRWQILRWIIQTAKR